MLCLITLLSMNISAAFFLDSWDEDFCVDISSAYKKYLPFFFIVCKMKFIRVLFISIMSNYSQQLLQPLVWMYFIVLVHRGNKCWISWPKLILTIIWGRLQDLNSLPLIMGAVGICIPVCLILMCSHLSDHLLWALFNYTVDNYDSFSGPSFIFIHRST